MTELNDELILEYLIENVSKNLIKNYPIEEILILDYCYKKNESIPKAYFSDFVSKVLNKQINSSSKKININKTDVVDCLFLESYNNLLSNRTKGLIKYAKSAKDFKAIVIIDTVSKKVDNHSKILNIEDSLDSKVFNLVKAYSEADFKRKIKSEYLRLQEYSLEINSDLEKRLDDKFIKKLGSIKKDLNAKDKFYSKFSNNESVFEIKSLIRELKDRIDSPLKKYIHNVDKKYNKIKKKLEDHVWDTEKRINRLITLSTKIEPVKKKYRLVSHRTGVKLCNSLEREIKNHIDNYNCIRDTKEGFKRAKNDISDYYKEIKSIFKDDINSSSVRKLNSIYSNIKRLSNKSFPDFIPSNEIESYYFNIKKVRDFVKKKYVNRVKNLVNKSSKYRAKIDKSLFSWKTKKFVEKLEGFNYELTTWSKCRII